MKYRTAPAENHTVLYLDGDVDFSCSPDAREQVLELLQEERHLLIDLSGVSHIDSSGVAVLVEGHHTAIDRQLRFGLVGVSQAALAVLQLARLDSVLCIHASIEEWMQAGD